MYTGEMINELMNMVARAEDQARATRYNEPAAREQQPFASRLVYATESRSMMIGVA